MNPSDVIVVPEPKLEAVEYWHFIGNSGVSATYMVRIERNEKAQILHNQIDNSPIAVELLLRADDDSNEVIGTLSFPIANLFSYGMEKSTYAVYPKGHTPTDKAVQELHKRNENFMLMRKRRMEAILSGVSDLNDGTVPPATPQPPAVTIVR